MTQATRKGSEAALGGGEKRAWGGSGFKNRRRRTLPPQGTQSGGASGEITPDINTKEREAQTPSGPRRGGLSPTGGKKKSRI